MKAATNDAGIRPRLQVLSQAIAEALHSASSSSQRVRAFTPSALASGGAILATALTFLPANPATAQDPEAEPRDEITVTGSRIVRQDFTANAPIVTIDEDQFQNTSTIGVETVLNQLPQFVPAVTQFTTGDVQQTATNSVGASRVSLRGLGPNRNLVLIDGRRGTPIDGTMVVDTNSIPASAVARVEIISGGASAVYGADAVGGVVNFILKDDFEGASIEARYGDTVEGGNETIEVSALLGANVADDRGNVMIGLEYSSRTKVQQWERDWRLDDLRSANTFGTAFFATETWFTNPQGIGTGGLACTSDVYPSPRPCQNNPTQAATNLVFNNRVPGTVVANTSPFFINRTPTGTGTVFTGLGGTAQLSTAPGSPEYISPYGGFDANGIEYHPDFPGLPFRKRNPDGRISENTLYQWASSPLDRYSAFGKGVFDVSDTVRVTAQAMFTKTATQSSLGLTSDAIGVHGAPFPFGTGIYEPSVIRDLGGNIVGTDPAYLPGGTFGLNCEAAATAAQPYNDGLPGCTKTEAWPVPAEVWDLYRSRPRPEMDVLLNRPLDFMRTAVERARGSDVDTTTYQLTMGLEGDLGADHSWDMSVSTGTTDSMTRQRGVGKLEMWRDIVGSPNFGLGFRQAGNPAGGGFQSGIASCETGLPLIRDFVPSQDCIDALSATLHNTQTVDQNSFEANLVGTLAEMGSGPLQYALGAAWREASIIYTPDQLVANQAVNETVMGLFPQQGYDGEFDVGEIYGELLIPIVSDGPAMIEHFTLELGGRYSDFSTVGAVDTYKALIDWGFFPRYRLRGGINRAHRAPNLAELYSKRTQVFSIFGAASVFGDQCSLRSSGPYSANQGTGGVAVSNVNGLAGAQDAEALCRQLMGVTGAEAYYDNRVPGDHCTVAGGFCGLGQPNATGQPALIEEQADTFTMGIAMDFLEGFRLTLDYYTIEIQDMIAAESGDAVYERCFSPTFNPAQDPYTAACNQIVRNPFSGGAASVDLYFTNLGYTQFSGVDLQLDWSRTFDFGGLGLNMVGNYNIESKTQENVRAAVVDWKGTQGCALQMQCQGYDYRVFTTMSYFRGPVSIQLRNQYWPSIKSAFYATNPATTQLGVEESHMLWALTGSYMFGERYTLRFGVENLLDEEPPESGTATTQNACPGTLNVPCAPLGGPWFTELTRGGGLGGGSTYDPLGRRGFISLTMDF
jgi:outer membrane receptor protein involved in Fe transport